MTSSTALTSAMNRHDYSIDRTIRSQSRKIQSAAANVITGMHVAADRVYRGARLQGITIGGVLRLREIEYRRERRMLEYHRQEGVQQLNPEMAVVGTTATAWELCLRQGVMLCNAIPDSGVTGNLCRLR